MCWKVHVLQDRVWLTVVRRVMGYCITVIKRREKQRLFSLLLPSQTHPLWHMFPPSLSPSPLPSLLHPFHFLSPFHSSSHRLPTMDSPILPRQSASTLTLSCWLLEPSRESCECILTVEKFPYPIKGNYTINFLIKGNVPTSLPIKRNVTVL